MSQAIVKQLTRELEQHLESFRFEQGCYKALDLFIHYWAYLHTDRYPLSVAEMKTIEKPEVTKTFQKVTHIICELAIRHGVTDVLGDLLCQYSSLAKDNAYYPTPKHVSKLMHMLAIGNPADNRPISIAEPCCGSGAIILETLEELYLANLDKPDPLGHVTIQLEDISGLLCKVVFLQLLFKLQHLKYMHKKPAQPAHVVIVQIDTISRKTKGVLFELSSPSFLTKVA